MDFKPFDPLEFKNIKINEAALGALKREIENILSSYVGWYDPFCELIQNALDAVEARMAHENAAGAGGAYKPAVDVFIDLDSNALTVTDNGIGLDQEKFEQFLAPNFSFKSGDTRGHKGVGATYVAYGFNYMRVSTKVPGFAASGRILNARTWLRANAGGANPKVEPDTSPFPDEVFNGHDRGVSVTVRFDATTHPKQLTWPQADTAEKWLKILSVKTAIGSVIPDASVLIRVRVRSKGQQTTASVQGTAYLWLHKSAPKTARIRDALALQEQLFKKYGPNKKLPDKLLNLDFLYDSWTPEEVVLLLGDSIDDDEKSIIAAHSPSISVEFGYTAKLWPQFNEALTLRRGHNVLWSGIQLAANNMPQGETITIPLNRNIGRQNQIHFLIHFRNYTPDLGRKGFHRELTDFAKEVSKGLTDRHLNKLRHLLKANTGVAPDLVRELEIGEWKKEMAAHENKKPLTLKSEHFFHPTEQVSITSAPTREQDVIALFHQLIAGGVIRGLRIMSTNERFTYDGLFRIAFDLDAAIYTYHAEHNPLGVSEAVANGLKGKVTDPRILEYKFSLDGLIEDIETQDKNLKDIDLCVVWETGELYKERYGITSLLIPENTSQRQYHGVTHVLHDLDTGAKHCDLIVLSELMHALNEPGEAKAQQAAKYE